MAEKRLPPSIARLQWKFIADAWLAGAIYTAVELRLADRLSAGAMGVAALAQATGTVEDALYRLLRALAGAGLFAERDDRCFELTPLASCLRLEADEVHAMALMFGDEHRRSWRHLTEAVRTGGSAFAQAHGMDLFEYLSQRGRSQDLFRRGMADHAALHHRAVIDAYDFGRCHRIVDVGGGDGALLAALFAAYPHIQGTLLDRPATVAAAQTRLAGAGLAARCELIAGDFFQAVPEGGDVYLLSAVLHDWDAERSTAILHNVARAMRGRGVLLIADMILPPGNEPCFGKLLDLNMMVTCPGGRERTRAELAALLAATGFELGTVRATSGLVSLVEAAPRRAQAGSVP